MRNVPFAAIGLASTLALAACTSSGIDMNAADTAPATKRAQPEYRRNPQPTQAYRLTMTIDKAPGPFAQMQALAQYDVVNPECLPPPNENPGGHTSGIPTDDVEIPLTRVSDNEYVGTVYADQMLDEDYHGRGVCRWKLIQARVHMRANGVHRDTVFIPNISNEKLLGELQETVYFNKVSYPHGEMDNFVDPGLHDRSRFGPSIMDEDLFTVTFTSRKEAP